MFFDIFDHFCELHCKSGAAIAFPQKKNELAREIRELRETKDGLPPTVAEIEECVLGPTKPLSGLRKLDV